MGQYDVLYKNQVEKIIANGEWDKDQIVRAKWADGTSAHAKFIISEKLSFYDGEVPILTTKEVKWENSIHEMLWFFVQRTSDCAYLDEHNVKLWKPWTGPDNTISKAYGFQLGKPIRVKRNGKMIWTNQIENLIYDIKHTPASRRLIISLWNIDDLYDMNLPPCVWNQQWIVHNGKLSLIVTIRSNDLALGQPFNVFQYYVSQRMVAQVTGYQVGELHFNINHAHIYERHFDNIAMQMEREPYPAPTLHLNPDIKNFDDFTIDDFKLVNYQHHPEVKYEIAK
jgi:thymidylate synthase